MRKNRGSIQSRLTEFTHSKCEALLRLVHGCNVFRCVDDSNFCGLGLHQLMTYRKSPKRASTTLKTQFASIGSIVTSMYRYLAHPEDQLQNPLFFKKKKHFILWGG
jgi:hypothetical protein